MIGQSAAERRLARGILPDPAQTTLPMMHSSTMARIDAGAAHRFGDDERTELRAQ